ncbi:NAD(P)-dependent alcohol dehydrogenase [Actinomadura adrarensis]|uniref:NAD(P)-dependent alcohol dehydrogenase n=1 Tax=Actinomadura adrarensis TaxID=1819600 RepID=A0ABW3CP23_9ACTN
MKAAVLTGYGPPDVVRVTEVDEPKVGDKDLLVRVHVTTVNRTDCGFRAARPFVVRLVTGIIRPRRKILGTEFAGVVERVGPGVTGFAVGDRVFGYNEGRFGAHAEYLSIPEGGGIATIPDGVAFVEAAAASEGSHYALSMVEGARARNGRAVLVYGATGAIGSAAVQLLKARGATVTAVCDTANMELVRSLGADRVIDYTVQDFTEDEQTYDAVLDTVGKSTFGRCKRLLKPDGVFMSSDLGPRGQNLVLPLTTRLRKGRRVKFPMSRQGRKMVLYFREKIESGEFRPVIDRHYPLDRIVDAYEYVDSERKIGNVVIDVVPQD